MIARGSMFSLHELEFAYVGGVGAGAGVDLDVGAGDHVGARLRMVQILSYCVHCCCSIFSAILTKIPEPNSMLVPSMLTSDSKPHFALHCSRLLNH